MTSPTTRTGAWPKRGMASVMKAPVGKKKLRRTLHVEARRQPAQSPGPLQLANPEQLVTAHCFAEEFVITCRRPAPTCQNALDSSAHALLQWQRYLQVMLHGQRHGLVQASLGIQRRTPKPISEQWLDSRRQGNTAARRPHGPAVIVVQVVGV